MVGPQSLTEEAEAGIAGTATPQYCPAGAGRGWRTILVARSRHAALGDALPVKRSSSYSQRSGNIVGRYRNNDEVIFYALFSCKTKKTILALLIILGCAPLVENI